jgi:hypothetical protein
MGLGRLVWRPGRVAVALATLTLNSTIAANGTGRIRFRPTNRQDWRVDQVSVKATTVGGSASCEAQIDGAFITILVAQADTAAGDPPIMCRNGHNFDVLWSNGTVGAPLEATIFYDDGE